MVLRISAQWWGNAWKKHLMAAWCWKLVPDGSTMLERSTWWQQDAGFERWMVAGCFEFTPNGWWRNASILRLMAGVILGISAQWWWDA
jgi:hypothetical protein